MLDRPARAGAAGFGAVEIQFPYNLAAGDLARANQAAGVDMALFNVAAGNLESGGAGLAALPGGEADFQAVVDQALGYAEVLEPANVNILAGWPPPELPRERCLDVLAGNLAFAAEAFAPLGVGVLLEAINTRDRPGFLVSSSADALAIIERADHPNLGLQYDIYHMQIMEGDLVPTLERLIGRIGHIQFADTPGRHQPGTGEINFPFLFASIGAIGYEGWLGAEYVPSGTTEESLGWLEPYL